MKVTYICNSCNKSNSFQYFGESKISLDGKKIECSYCKKQSSYSNKDFIAVESNLLKVILGGIAFVFTVIISLLSFGYYPTSITLFYSLKGFIPLLPTLVYFIWLKEYRKKIKLFNRS